MNMFSGFILFAVAATLSVGYLLLLINTLQQKKRLAALESQLNIFVDASIGVAQSVDRLLSQGKHADTSNVSSRRWIVQEAKSRVQQGENLHDIAAPLGLSKDEVRLLQAHLH